MKTTRISACATAILFAVSAVAFASGTGDYGQEGLYQNNVDTLYEEGKSYYYARGDDGKRIDYCIKKGDQLERVSRRSLKQFVNTSADELSAHLCDCDEPGKMIDGRLDDRQLGAVIYYLNKRYRLSLYSSG